jgi:uncharacterized protein YbaR (Trm112 family)
MDKSLLEIIVCPVCHGKLKYIKHENQSDQKLVCQFDRLAYSIDDGIPVLLAEKADTLNQEQLDKLIGKS